jgi:hypothetical protein
MFINLPLIPASREIRVQIWKDAIEARILEVHLLLINPLHYSYPRPFSVPVTKSRTITHPYHRWEIIILTPENQDSRFDRSSGRNAQLRKGNSVLALPFSMFSNLWLVIGDFLTEVCLFSGSSVLF